MTGTSGWPSRASSLEQTKYPVSICMVMCGGITTTRDIPYSFPMWRLHIRRGLWGLNLRLLCRRLIWLSIVPYLALFCCVYGNVGLFIAVPHGFLKLQHFSSHATTTKLTAVIITQRATLWSFLAILATKRRFCSVRLTCSLDIGPITSLRRPCR